MKKTVISILLTCLLALALCACSDVDLTIDGVEAPETEHYSLDAVYSGAEGEVSVYEAPAEDGDESEALDFDAVYDGAEGAVSADSGSGSFLPGTEVTAHAQPNDGYAFFCWTENGTLAQGGEPVSYQKDYTFPLEADTTLYANFRVHSSALVRYHANGGTSLRVSDTTPEATAAAARETTVNEIYWDDFSLDYFLYPNAPGDMGYFEREGYTLVGYNTQPDESGEFFNLGGKVFQDTDQVIELWCVWREQSPVSDFTFEYDSYYGGWDVTAYNGKDELVVIPSSYENEPVVCVSPNCFTGNETVTAIVFPSCLKVIADNSCSDMPNLTTLVIFDSLDYLSDASFNNDPSLYTVFFSAATNPHYTNWFNNHSKKIELMYYWRDSERPKMIILGGSSTAYAVDAQQLESLLDRDYLVLNCGSNGANLFNMTVEWAMRYLNEGDFLLHIIEYSYWQMGGVQCTWETFRSFESCYNVFSWVRAGQYYKFFDCFNNYLSHRKEENETDYESYVSSLAGTTGYYDIQGTLTVVTRPNGSDTFWKNRTIPLRDNFLYDFMVRYCNYQYSRLDAMGVNYAMAFTPLNRNALKADTTDQDLEDFERYLDENLNVTVVSDIQENIMEPAVFFDDDYHLAAPARAEYTERLAGDLNDYFATLDEGADEANTED